MNVTNLNTLQKMGVAAVCGLLAAAPLCARALLTADYREMLLRYHAAGSANPALLTGYDWGRVSYLEAAGAFRTGALRNYYEADKAVKLDIATASYWQLSDRLTLGGGLSYGFDKGEHMTGSAFMNPEYVPFDLVEMADSTAGTKRREWYVLRGEVGYRLAERVSLGARMVFRTGNYAKFKDLRHQNTLMDMQVSLGASYKLWERLTLGLSYTYGRNVETLYFKTYGNTDRQYATLVSFGGFWGRSELFGESGYTADARPLFTRSHGGAVQMVYCGDTFRWLGELGYTAHSGRFGNNASASITYSTHTGSDWHLRSKLVWEPVRLTHILEATVGLRSLENFENAYKESTDESGVSQIIYYGSNRVGEKEWLQAGLFYRLSAPGKWGKPAWQFSVAAVYSGRNLTASQYPFYRKQEVHAASLTLQGGRNWFKGRNIYSLETGLSASSGWGNPVTDGCYVPVSDTQKQPAARKDLLQLEYDYLTAFRAGPRFSAGYERNIQPGLWVYTQAGVAYERAFGKTFAGDGCTVVRLTAGVRF